MIAIIRQVDLDTCLTALLCGVSDVDTVRSRPGGAEPQELSDPLVLCIEAGGSGEIRLNNYDHHDTSRDLPPACVQAWRQHGADPSFARLVDYVAAIDTAQPIPPIHGLSLSGLFSGLRLAIRSPEPQLRAGMALLLTVIRDHIDPFGVMPERQEWNVYREAKLENERRRAGVLHTAQFFATESGLRVGLVVTDYIGALGLLYAEGCDIAIGCHPHFGTTPVRKVTIGGNPRRRIKVNRLLPLVNRLEPGWGGPAHGTIIASPHSGSRLPLHELVEVVRAAFRR